jgi:hypothetical protein
MDDSNAPATKGDIQQLSSELRSEMQHMYDDLVERMSDSETKLLNAFYTFAQSNQTRLSANEREAASMKERIAILESRITEVEKRLNMPPAA